MLHSLHFSPGRFLTCLSLSLSLASPALAVKDETNQGRWETPAKEGPDAEVPGFLINMGPTGARGILKESSYIVKYIFKKSPAAGVLEIEDEVYGADGKKFGSHVFGGTNINRGLEGPLQDLGLAIEDSEGEDGVLELMVKRGGEKLKVQVQLEQLGRFADSFPVDCPKTKILQERALKYLVDHPGGLDSQGRCVATLAMIASDDSKISRVGKKMALDWNKPYDDGTWSWHLGFQGIALSEYHLLTGDRKVLSTLDKTLDLLEGAQWKSPINHVNREKMKNPASKEEVDRAQNLYSGGFGHAPYNVIVKRGGGGYGPMQWPTCLALMTWQLAEDCGLEYDPTSRERSYQFLENGTTDGGKVAYGGEFTLNNGVVDPKQWKKNTAHKFSHKSGLAYQVHQLSPERKGSKKAMKLHLSNIDAAYRDMADGHACGLMGFTWGLAGVYASDDRKLKEKITDYYKAYWNMARCHGSDSYVVLPNRDYADGSYYRKNIRTHTTAAMAFIYSFSSPKLRVHGVDGSEAPKVVEKAKTPDNPYRTFTNAEGTGSFVGSLMIFDHRGGIVRIRKRNGSVVDVDFNDLSEKDQEYLRAYYYANRD
ncbi:hypothetical protein JO972_07780 [Verrucomicrobiaceae bacterium 5K15]|uniref:Uncharacterized protein n=1 Tax=Oceaniferula flava TaxID=2800421 RepID=A0AAE2SB40_9BACT|nr:DUF6288 domain-containing protein [Oceaniferula flavus]MBK1854855.1 hypothetical protein [Oceaniferula flavus]MBM1136161.1 hypothetical protein [Oceaniferula flavus]